MTHNKLDLIDKQILTHLQADGRITNVELSKRVGISAPPCLRRVCALEKAGYIKGYYTHLRAEFLGFGVTAFAMIGLGKQSERDLEAFKELCNSWPYVRECHMLNGEIDFLLKCVAPDLASFQSFIKHELTAVPYVNSVKTAFVIEECKFLSGVPFELKQPESHRGTIR
jgi:DNA-binding Lrp family transcriptional regulator